MSEVTSLHRLRREAEYRSAADFADAVGMERAAWLACERGTQGIPASAQPVVARELGVSRASLRRAMRESTASSKRENSPLQGSVAGSAHPSCAASIASSFPAEDPYAGGAADPVGVIAEDPSSSEGAEQTIETLGGIGVTIEADWARAVADELGVELSDSEAEEIARYAEDNLWDSDLLRDLVHDQLVAEIESHEEWRTSRAGMPEPLSHQPVGRLAAPAARDEREADR